MWREDPTVTLGELEAAREARIMAHRARLAGAFDQPRRPRRAGRLTREDAVRGGIGRGAHVSADRERRDRLARALLELTVRLSGLPAASILAKRQSAGEGVRWRRAFVEAAVAEGLGAGAAARALDVAGSAAKSTVPAEPALVRAVREAWGGQMRARATEERR